MNLYIRYFNDEIIVKSLEEAIAFIANLPIVNFRVDEDLTTEIRDFLESTSLHPKRIKIKSNIFFILIKTTAETLDEFKDYKKGETNLQKEDAASANVAHRPSKADMMAEEKAGWYEGNIIFKRVLLIPSLQKYQYVDTHFVARMKANSANDCYFRLIEHLKNRQDVDPRSQFPSNRGKNFSYKYLGEERPA